jgi:molecular chaperone GrpE
MVLTAATGYGALCCAVITQGLYKQMVDIMKSLGVDAVDTVGSAFDPEVHEAIMREPNDEVPDGTVIMEFRKGFKMGERMLRPAMVKVSFTEGAAEVSGADTDSEPVSPEGSS